MLLRRLSIQLKMNKITDVPYMCFSKKAFLPKLFSQNATTFIYSLFSPINGAEIVRGENYICCHFEIILPLGTICYLKSIHFEENEIYVKDERYDRGISLLEAGKTHYLTFKIPLQMNTLEIKRGELLGALIFDRPINFVPYNIMGDYEISTLT